MLVPYGGRMSTMRSALEELRAEDLRFASDEELEGDLVEIERASRALEAERSRRLTEVERRGTWGTDGHLSIVSWLAARLWVGFGPATQQVGLARALRHMPATADALGSGDVSSESAALLVSAREAAPEAFAGSEEMLVQAAENLSARDFRSAVAYWRQMADSAQASERARLAHEGRRLHVSPLLDGMMRIDGDLDPESARR
jgi:hypothetical protein